MVSHRAPTASCSGSTYEATAPRSAQDLERIGDNEQGTGMRCARTCPYALLRGPEWGYRSCVLEHRSALRGPRRPGSDRNAVRDAVTLIVYRSCGSLFRRLDRASAN